MDENLINELKNFNVDIEKVRQATYISNPEVINIFSFVLDKIRKASMAGLIFTAIDLSSELKYEKKEKYLLLLTVFSILESHGFKVSFRYNSFIHDPEVLVKFTVQWSEIKDFEINVPDFAGINNRRESDRDGKRTE